MINIRDISIKNKLVLMQVFTSIFVLGSCFAAFVITDITGYKERKVSSIISIAQIIGSNSISAIKFLDNDAGESNLQNVESDIVNASIIDTKGRIFAKYTRPGKPSYVFSPPYKDTYRFDDDFLYVYKTMVDNNETLGTVCLQVELTELEQIKSQKFQIAAILLIVGMGLAFLLAFINQGYISKPLLNLVTVMNQIRENNDYNRHVAVKGKDEISALSLEFNNLMDEVVKSHQKKDEFIGIASHELKTPLTSVKLYLELLSKIITDQKTNTFVIKARESVNKLHNLILDLLDVSKIQSGQLQLNLKEVGLDELVDECIHDSQVNTTRHLIIRDSKPTHAMILADRDRIEQVIVNLLSNAIKYSPEGKIIVTTERSDNAIRVSVRDFGIGIAASEHKKIFERFYRAKDGNSVISGFGLGLYICSQIIKRHSGSIWVESEEGSGSVFIFELPVSNSVSPV